MRRTLGQTASVHVLSNRPLTSSHGKKVIAKEFGLWEGSNGYYRVDHMASRKYLAYSGILTNMMPPHYQSSTWISSAMLHLLCMAVITDRIIILPAVFHKDEYFAPFEWLDMSKVLRLIEWREANFFDNPKVTVDEGTTFAHVELSDHDIIVGEVGPAGKLFNVQAFDNRMNPVPQAPDLPTRQQISEHRQNIWAVLTSSTVVNNADVVYVALNDEFEMYEEVCAFRKEARSCGNLPGVDPTLGLLFDAMSWCEIRDGYVAKERKERRYKPTYDCKTRTDMMRDVRILQKARHDSKRLEEKPSEEKQSPLAPKDANVASKEENETAAAADKALPEQLDYKPSPAHRSREQSPHPIPGPDPAGAGTRGMAGAEARAEAAGVILPLTSDLALPGWFYSGLCRVSRAGTSSCTATHQLPPAVYPLVDKHAHNVRAGECGLPKRLPLTGYLWT